MWLQFSFKNSFNLLLINWGFHTVSLLHILMKAKFKHILKFANYSRICYREAPVSMCLKDVLRQLRHEAFNQRVLGAFCTTHTDDQTMSF